jgi:hypothetical protein
VTPVGVRDGDPDALAGLCDRRGPAVLAYCEVVAGTHAAAVAAADAFAAFRVGVVATPDLANLNPEALLISATRHAAARHAGSDAPPGCARVPALLAARADRSITLADHDWLQEHLASCWTCRAPVARFEAADRAYRDPPRTRLDPAVAAAILAALNAAAPIAGQAPEPPAPEPVLQSDNGSGAQAPPADAQAAPGVAYGDQATAAWQASADDVLADPAAAAAQPPQPDRAARRTVKIGGLSRRPRSEPGAAPMPAQPTTSAAESRAGGGAHLPRERRTAPSAGGGRHAVPLLRRGLVLPVVLVVLAIVIALLIAGVFGGNEPASAPQSFAPDASAPAATKAAPVVVVPGAADASAADVERAKARTRAARRKAAAARKAAETAAATSATAGASGPADAPATGAATAAGNTAAAPPAKQTPPTPDKAKIDAGTGATGAEQVAPPQDTSTVPDLAPPVEPADSPGQ